MTSIKNLSISSSSGSKNASKRCPIPFNVVYPAISAFSIVRRESLIPNSIKRLKAKRALVLIQFGLPRPAFKKILAFLFFSASLSISKLTSKAPKPV